MSVASTDVSAFKAHPPEGSSTPKGDVKKKGRKGKGSKQHQAEKFRSRKNTDFDNELQAKIQDLKISLGYTPQELFGTRSVTSVIKPQLEFQLDTTCIGLLCDYASEILSNSCKLSPSIDVDESAAITYDAETLMWVTALQIEAKLYAARTGTQFSVDPSEQTSYRVQRTNLLFPDALIPLAIVIDQIGRFSFNDQIFIPAKHTQFSYPSLLDLENPGRAFIPSLVVFTPPGVITKLKDHHGNRLYARILTTANEKVLLDNNIAIKSGDSLILTPQFIDQPQNYPMWLGNIEFVTGEQPPAPPSIEQIANRYAELKGRVSKKLTNAFVEVHASSGKGNESQIVYRRKDSGDLYIAWSPRSIRADALEMGTILGFGFNNDGPLTKVEAASIMATIDTSAGLRCLANVLTKKIR